MSVPPVSLVVPVHNVAAYLPAFLGSLDAQRGAADDVEMVFVDDGSTDDGAAIIESWLASLPAARRELVRLVRQPNGGAAAARNTGLELISGSWVSFPDPDDVLAPGYLAEVRRAIAQADEQHASMLSTHLVVLDDRTGKVTDTHPLRAKYADGRRVVDLVRHPQWIHLQAGSAYFRRDRIEQLGLRFDPAIRPNFEDSSFLAHYLASYPRPRMFVLPDAFYRYRVRSDGSSQVQASWAKPEKYTTLPEVGHLSLLRTVRDTYGAVPEWLQNVILYEIAWYLRTDARPNSPTPGLAPEVVARYFELLPQVLAYIDAWAIDAFRTTWLSDDMRATLVTGVKGERLRPDRVQLDTLDEGRQLVRLRYYFGGDRPVEQFRSRGYLVAPVFEKVRSIRFLGRTMLHQRIVWLPATGTLSVVLDGQHLPFDFGPDRAVYNASAVTLWNRLAERLPPTELETMRARPKRTLRAKLGRVRREVRSRLRVLRRSGRNAVDREQARTRAIVAAAASPPVRLRYRDAWLFMDRDTLAQDNAERLYRWVREHRRDVNAFFVLARTSSDWDRLAGDGFRLVEHGSTQHTLALLNCANLVSSQIDHYVVAPLDSKVYGPRRWRYTFLQHGVTKDDLSSWIDSKPIDLMISATPDEHESFVGDDTPYRVTTHEVVMTGFPRHDRLLELGRAVPPARRNRILVAPTWRRDLLLASVGRGNERELRADFWHTEYAAQWRSIVESERLNRVAAEHDCIVEFLPHPNMQDYLADSPLPDHVVVHRFSEVDVQQLLAESVALVTDYSSMAFESAYLERPVVYFQFDQASFWNGAHAYRRGSWDYDKDGFGPVLLDAEQVIDEVAGILGRGGAATPEYAERMQVAFPLRDGRCCERTFDAIEALGVPLRYEQAYLRLEPRDVLTGVVNDTAVVATGADVTRDAV